MTLTPTQRGAVVAEARTWLGTPYHHHARIKGVGVDCVHLLCAVYEAAGVAPPIDPGRYASDWHLHQSPELYAAGLAQHCTPLPVGQPAQPGDVALYRFGRCFSHGAIVLDAGLLLHAYLGRGVILTTDREHPLSGRPVQFWSLTHER